MDTGLKNRRPKFDSWSRHVWTIKTAVWVGLALVAVTLAAMSVVSVLMSLYLDVTSR